MLTITAGCDPGLTGALAIFEDGKPVHLIDMPIMAKLTGKGNQVNGSKLTSILLYHGVKSVRIEKVASMPGQGVVSVFNFGHSVGIVHGVLMALQIPFEVIPPGTWKRKHGLLKKDKDFSRTLCITKFPHLADQLELKKHHGRADAILIGIE